MRISGIGSSWAYLQWENPPDSAELRSFFSHYEISVISSRNGSGYVFPVVHRDTSFNITGLQHETLYEFSITAVSETCGFLARSLSSDLAHSTTKVQGTAIHLAYNMHIDGFKLQALIIIIT